jgi:hypothetical protein
MHRQSVRGVLEFLVTNALVVETRTDTQLSYSLGDLNLIRKKATTVSASIQKQAKSLHAVYEQTPKTHKVTVLTGEKGLQTVLLDEIRKNELVKSFHLHPVDAAYKRVYIANQDRRKKMHIPLLVASPLKVPRIPLAKSKKIVMKSSLLNIHVYGEKTSFVYNVNPIHIVSIKLRGISEFFSNLFDKL